jgi:precorrin-6A/cobalt-precorrin-6A reductase
MPRIDSHCGGGAGLDSRSGIGEDSHMRVLVLGGTTEASMLAAKLAERADIDAVLSLAGRTANPRPSPLPTRTGGFGGAEGLARWLSEHQTDAVVDATHPFAATMSRNAAAACFRLGLPLLGLRRPPWQAQPGDRWIEIATMADAIPALGSAPHRVFLTIGRLELAPFATAPQHFYLVRSIEPIGEALPVPRVRTLRARGPFDEAGERALLEGEHIDIIVTKNSGGSATYAKIAAARTLGLPVIVVARPEKPAVAAVASVTAALEWIEIQQSGPVLRGV